MADKLTDETIELIRGKIAAGQSNRSIARDLGLHHSTLAKYREGWQTAKFTTKDGEVKYETFVPERKDFVPLPDSVYRRKSTLVDSQGKVIQTWHVQAPEAQAFDVWARAITEGLKDGCYPYPAATMDYSGEQLDNLLTLYPIGDHHFGMLAWRPEVGASYDVEIAEALLAQAGDELIRRSPRSSTAIIAALGDYLHYDGWKALTPENRNLLDTDTRFPKMVRAAMRALHRLIDAALERHQKVHVIVEIGNHDTAAAVHLAEHLNFFYGEEPRVTIDTSPAFFHYYRFGKVLLGTHHGHTVKVDKLGGVMAQDQAKDWGETEYRYWHTGHRHHDELSTQLGCTVETHAILAPADAYAHQLGYRPIRSMKAIVYHNEYGEVERRTVNPRMFE
jgi:hypothetical protein